eukprot:1780271-Pleurochrysis_carterae.AAC.1
MESLFTFSWRVSRGDDPLGSPTMPAPEGVVTANTPSVSSLSSRVRRLNWLALIALGSGDSRTLGRRPKHAESFTPGWQAPRGDNSLGAPAMPALEVSNLAAQSARLSCSWIRRPAHSCQKA